VLEQLHCSTKLCDFRAGDSTLLLGELPLVVEVLPFVLK
jgi:hypothetical protein